MYFYTDASLLKLFYFTKTAITWLKYAIFTQILTQPGYEVYPSFLKSREWAFAGEGAFDRELTVQYIILCVYYVTIYSPRVAQNSCTAFNFSKIFRVGMPL